MIEYDSCPFELSIFAETDQVAVMEVYSDASTIGGHFSIGSLLFRKKNIRPFNAKWRAMLRRYQLEYFHMTDCNAGKGPFKQLSREDCDNCAREAISCILEFATKGSIFSIKISDFEQVIGNKGVMPNPFTLGAWYTIFDIRHWADKHDPHARISYVFEAGDLHQTDVNTLFKAVRDDPERRNSARYRTHAFVPKLDSLPSQAADILAWHGAKHQHRKERDKESVRYRGDFNEIVSKLRVTDGHHDRAWLQNIVEIADKHSLGGEIAGLAFRMHSENQKHITKQIAKVISKEPNGGEKLDIIRKLAQRGSG